MKNHNAIAGQHSSRLLAAIVFAVLSVNVPSLVAQTAPADNAIKAAVYDLDRIAKELPRLTPSRQANIKRIKRSLNMAEQRLKSSKNQQHQSWIEANQRAKEYKELLVGLTTPKAPERNQASRTPPADATPQASDPVRRSSAGAGPAAAQAPTSQAGSTQAARNAAQASQPTGMPRYERTKFNKFQRDLSSVIGTYKQLDPKLLHNQRELKNWRGRMNFLNQGYAKYAKYVDDADVVKVGKTVQALISHYQQTEKNSLAAFAALGDIPGGIQKIQNYYGQTQMPERLAAPYTRERATAWAGYLKSFREQAKIHANWLKNVLATTHEYNRAAKNALNGTIGHRANGAVKRAIEDTRRQFEEPLNRIAAGSRVDFASKLTPQDKHKIRNSLLGDGDYEALVTALDNAKQAIQSRQIIDSALGSAAADDSKQLLANIETKRQKIATLFETVLDEVRMPKAKSADLKLIEAVKQAFARQEKPPVVDRMVINSEPTTRRESRAWWSGGVATIADYDWTEFQVATAEKVNGKHYIFYNNIHYYTSGSRLTPLNKWIVNRRFQGSRILSENISK